MAKMRTRHANHAVRPRRAAAALLPYRSHAVLIGRGAVRLGPAELYLGVLADGAAAEAHFDAAAAWAEANDAPPWLAWTAALRGSGREQARALAGELGLGRPLARLNRPAAGPR